MGCWLWGGSYYPNGYGQAWSKPLGRGIQAHRLVYEMLVGQIPDGLQIDHICRVRGCVNPAHLRVVTCEENIMATGSTCVARKNRAKVACPQGHSFDGANTYMTKGGKRHCRTCKMDQKRANRRASAYEGFPTHDAVCSMGAWVAATTGIGTHGVPRHRRPATDAS